MYYEGFFFITSLMVHAGMKAVKIAEEIANPCQWLMQLF